MSAMFATRDRRIVVFGADKRGKADRLQELLGCSIQRVTDPLTLSHVLVASSDSSLPGGRLRDIAGLAFDLTTSFGGGSHRPAENDVHTGSDAKLVDSHRWIEHDQDEYLTRFCSALLVSLPHIWRLPLIMVSHDGALATMLRAFGAANVTHLHPDADDNTWRSALGRGLATDAWNGEPCLHIPVGKASVHAVPTAPELTPQKGYRLNAHAWIDLARCLVSADEHHASLTGREVRVLEVLMRAPGYFYSASEIARQTAPAGSYVDAHCIEQTISGLRRKLGETARAQRAIISRRGLGYALVAEQRLTRSRY